MPDDITAIGVSPIQFMGACSQFLQQEYDFSLDNHWEDIFIEGNYATLNSQRQDGKKKELSSVICT